MGAVEPEAEAEGYVPDWVADNYRQLVAEGNATWPEVAERIAATGDRDAAVWAAAQGRAAASASDDAPKGRRSAAADKTTGEGGA